MAKGSVSPPEAAGVSPPEEAPAEESPPAGASPPGAARAAQSGRRDALRIWGDESGERLHIFVATEDGFEIARADLRLRGMGDLFGERQSGLPTFRIADPLRDEELNEVARVAAERLLEADPELEQPRHAPMRKALGTRYKRSLELFRVG